MIARVKKTDEGYVVVIPADVAEAWDLRENVPVEVHRLGETGDGDSPKVVYATPEQAMEAYERTRPQHDEAYRELAKGPSGLGPHDSPPFDLRKW
jgi:hypothetical protein